MDFYDDGAQGARLRGRHQDRARRRCSRARKFVFRFEAHAGHRAAGTDLSDQRSRSRVAAVVLPVEHAAGRRADQGGQRSGTLHAPAVLEKQVRRMLADPRAEALSTRFAAQWLRLQDVEKMHPDALLYPVLRQRRSREAFIRETELFFDSIVREDRNVLDLLTADYTFVNERIARHYGIPNIIGDEFRACTVPDAAARHARAGQRADADVGRRPHLAGAARQVDHGSAARLAAAAAAAERAGARGDQAATADGKPLSVRERMEEHRKNPACNSCHRVIDPLGLALENFDVIGEWRIKDNGVPRRLERRALRRHADRRAGGSARRRCSGSPRTRAAQFHREPDDVRARPPRRVLRPAGGARDRRRRRRRTTTTSRRSCSASSIAPAFQMSTSRTP